MKVSELHAAFLKELAPLLPGWTFVASQRGFKRVDGQANWLFHLAFVNHECDFDVVGNVAVEFIVAKKRVAIVGAQLGNIVGVGQTRHSVRSLATAAESAKSLVAEFNGVGIPFLQRYSNPSITVTALQRGGSEALLISPFEQNHTQQIMALKKLVTPPYN
ncbi:hypothetical protein ACFPAG_01135 [Vogesella sp. GCM10023246]|uniref:Uncharacterized protein n=1 Tax=Vogesella oryzagri TaxID=3160864 RepID=A0ABV1M0Z4_9NEIS